ncbi:MAG: YraN family protein [bacterium]
MSIRALGLAGERIAARYLRRHGYRIVERRWSCRFGEIDLVAEFGDEVVFVEVKTRSGTGYGGGLAAVGFRKSARLRAAVYSYLQSRGWTGRPFRLDVVTVEPVGFGRARVSHYPSAIGEE